MAKSAPDTKLEDVLSSVRRLVSDELPRNERPKVPEGPGALVLTDSQRIESNAAIRIAGRSLEERIAELEAAVSETANDDEFEPDGSEDQAVHRPDRIVYTRPPQPEESEEMGRNTLRLSQIALIDTGPANEDPDEDNGVQLQFHHETSRESTDEAPMAEDVKETQTAADVHIFSSPDDEIARIEARLNGGPEPERAPETKTAAPIVLPLEDAVPIDEARVDPDADDAPETDTAKNEKADGPQEVAKDAPSASAEDDFDSQLKAAISSANEIEEPAEDVSDTDDQAETELAEAAIGTAVTELLDEDALRPMVARLIREELQGELGERITRNVRKLVRREILRALAARDAE
ncbi:MAG: hypothetical protein HKN27_09200 [Silicimonas sp.]|nr:hypothetical protein [Silicimonas sp.]